MIDFVFSESVLITELGSHNLCLISRNSWFELPESSNLSDEASIMLFVFQLLELKKSQ
jgi:hypothetical protein